MKRILVDSGAFTLWRQGGEIDIEVYATFLLEQRHNYFRAVTLDTIPGAPGAEVTPAQVEQAAQDSAENTQFLREMGTDPIPVFHQGEDFKWLAKMIDDGYDYVGLAPRKTYRTPQKVAWLHDVFTYLCLGGKYPPVKLHAFGEATSQVLNDFPWFSADSTGWLKQAAYGSFYVPAVFPNGDWDWHGVPQQVVVSRGLPGENVAQVGHRPGGHFDTMGPHAKKAIHRYCEEQGHDLEALAGDGKVRAAANVRFFESACKRRPPVPYVPRTRGLFSAKGKAYGLEYPPWDLTHLQFFFAGANSSNTYNWSLWIEKAVNSLVSYASIGGTPEYLGKCMREELDLENWKLDNDKKKEKV